MTTNPTHDEGLRDPVDARDISCGGLANVDPDTPGGPRWFNGHYMVPIHHYADEIERRHDVYTCDVTGCRN
jgi:hypothetical protein